MIGVITPYVRDERTAAALRVAEFAARIGSDVTLIGTYPCKQNVHAAWDTRVLANVDKYHKRLSACKTVVHFDLDPLFLPLVRMTTAESTRHVVAVDWHSLKSQDVRVLHEYDAIVLPSRGCYDAITRVAGRTVARKTAWCRWRADSDSVQRRASFDDVNACILCDSSAINGCGAMILEVIDKVLSACPHAHITVLSLSSWCRRDRRKIRELTKRWRNRLVFRPAGCLIDIDTEFQSYSWVVIPSLRASFGSFVVTALACGASVIANDVSPFSELIRNGRNGVLVPCEHVTNGSWAPVAVPNIGSWINSCISAFLPSKAKSAGFDTSDIDTIANAFDSTWSSLLTSS